MNVENQVTNLELSKRLKELDVPQESLFFWHIPILAPDWHISLLEGERDICCCPEHYSAFTVAELGNFIYFPKLYMGAFPQIFMNLFKDETNEANIRAKMLIHLLENNLIKIEDLK